MFRLALRNVFRQRLRSALTLSSIVMGVVALALSGGFIADIYLQLGEAIIHSQTGHIQIAKAGYFAEGTRSPEKYRIEQPGAIREVAQRRDEVQDTLVRVVFSGLLSNGRADYSIVGEGVEANREANLGTFMTIFSGRNLTDQDTFGILIGQGVAQSLNLKPGDHATLLAHTAEGAINTLEVVIAGVFQSFLKDYDARAIRIPLSAARNLLYTGGANSVVVSLKQTEDTDRIAAYLRQQFGAGYDIKTWDELNDFYAGTVALYDRQFGVMQVIILVMVLLTVANSINMSAFERTGEFGTLMALGNSRGKLFRLLLAENLLLGLIGATTGLISAYFLARGISAIGIPMPPPPNSNSGFTSRIQIVPSVFAAAFAIGLVATLVAALVAARRVFKLKVAEALRENI